MAKSTDIEIRMSLRPCFIGGGDSTEKALFHGWCNRAYIIEPSPLKGGHPGGQVLNTYGIVELEDGSVVEVPPCNIKFIDPSHEGYAWPPTTDL